MINNARQLSRSHLSLARNTRKNITRWEYTNVTWRMIYYLFIYLRLSTDSNWTETSPSTHPKDHTQVNSTVDIWTWTWLRRIYTVHWCADCGSLLGLLYTIYRVTNVIYVTVALVYINLQSEQEFSSSTRFGLFQKFGKIWLGALSSPVTPKETILHGVRVLVDSYLIVRFDLPSSINFRDIYGFPIMGPSTLMRGSP